MPSQSKIRFGYLAYAVLALLAIACLLAAIALNDQSTAFWSGLLSNLTAGWIGALITIAVIDKLLARHKDEELQPVRLWFLREVAKRLNLLIEEFLFTFERISVLKFLLESEAVTQALSQLQKTLWSSARTPISAPTIMTTPELADLSLKLSQAVDDLAILGNRMEEIDRLIQLYAAVLSPQMLAESAKLSSLLMNDGRKFHQLAVFLRGLATQREREGAMAAYADLKMMHKFFDSMAETLALVDGRPQIDTEYIVDVSTQIGAVQVIVKILDPVLYPQK